MHLVVPTVEKCYNEEIQLSQSVERSLFAFLGHSTAHSFYAGWCPSTQNQTHTKWLKEKNIPVFKWLGNSLDLNPIENVWNMIKNKVQEAQPSIYFIFLFYLYIYLPDSQESDVGANT